MIKIRRLLKTQDVNEIKLMKYCKKKYFSKTLMKPLLSKCLIEPLKFILATFRYHFQTVIYVSYGIIYSNDLLY